MTEQGFELQAFSFVYDTNYAVRPDALEVDPVSLGIHGQRSVKGKALLPLIEQLGEFRRHPRCRAGLLGRRVIEAKLKVPANSLQESQYLLHAGSERVGALDIRSNMKDGVFNCSRI